MENSILKKISEEFSTPAFVFDTDTFASRADSIKKALGENIPLCFSIKANPFLLTSLPDSIDHVEVCSPGELTICERLHIAPDMIIYSGVNKGTDDIERAIRCHAGILTAESLLHVTLINEAAIRLGEKVNLILRLSNGNQFGMDKGDIIEVIDHQDRYPGLSIAGLHYYTGTQKKKADLVTKDIAAFENFIRILEQEHGFHPIHIEYGPGIAAEYFNPPYEEKDEAMLAEAAAALRDFASRYPVTVEMGRFLASSCGTYLTAVADLKITEGTHYVICDGGMNHLKYYGQTMAMQVPPITVLGKEGSETDYTLCGSLCTTADLLVRKVTLPALALGDVLAFHRCGAYTVTEGIGLFLSRTLPRILLYSQEKGVRLVRDFYPTDLLNTPEMEV